MRDIHYRVKMVFEPCFAIQSTPKIGRDTEVPLLFYAVCLILSRINLNNGKRISTMAMIVIGPAIGRLKKIMKSPSENKSDCRSFGSAIGPKTIARTAGATG